MAIGLDGPRWGPASGGTPQALVVLLHGLGADGFDLIDLAPGWGKAVPHAAFVAPHAPEPCDMAPYGKQWFSLQDRTPAMMRAGIEVAAATLAPWLEAERARLGLGWDKVALMGFSQGAMTALFAGLRRPVAPRGILAFSGALIAPERLADATARPPILLVHGEDDEVVPVTRSRAAQSALEASGFGVTALYCPRLGHGIDDAGLSAGALFLQRIFALPGAAA